jgi:hypothetical protein
VVLGLYELVQKLQISNPNLLIKTICVQDLDKPRDFRIDLEKSRLVTDPQGSGLLPPPSDIFVPRDPYGSFH